MGDIMGDKDKNEQSEFKYITGYEYPEKMSDMYLGGANARRTLLYEMYIPLIGAATFGGGSLWTNIYHGRPVFSGAYRTIGLTLAGYFGYKFLKQWTDKNHNWRDAMLRHYVQLHEEEFPPPQRKRWGEVLRPWAPTH